MKPLGAPSELPEDPRPTYISKGFVRIDWNSPINRLHFLIASQQDDVEGIFERSFRTLAAVYEGTFGDEDGRVKCPLTYEMVLTWLYMMEDDFVISLERNDTLALLLLAYYAPLLKTLKRDWFVEGWAEYIMTTVRSVTPDTYLEYLEWAEDAVHVLS